MAIGNAVQRGNLVYVYDEKGRVTAMIGAGSLRGDGLKGHTSSTVNIQQGSQIHTYDGKGRKLSTTSAR